jgi:hypothetical protein
MACGALAMGTILTAPLGARALDFDWYFPDQHTGEITRGTVKGLVEGYNSGGAGELLTVLESPVQNVLGSDWQFQYSIGSYAFYVKEGKVVGADALYQRLFQGSTQSLSIGLSPAGNLEPRWGSQIFDGITTASTAPDNTFFTSRADPASAPAPLPIFGAAVAFGYGRRLRSRVRVARLQSGVALTD